MDLPLTKPPLGDPHGGIKNFFKAIFVNALAFSLAVGTWVQNHWEGLICTMFSILASFMVIWAARAAIVAHRLQQERTLRFMCSHCHRNARTCLLPEDLRPEVCPNQSSSARSKSKN